MNIQFNHKLLSSFNLFVEHELLKRGEAFSNISGKLFPSSRVVNNINYYNSPNAQWVYDSSISGAEIPSGIYVNGNFTPRSANTSLDFIGGGAFTNESGNITASYAKKDFNFYFQPESETLLLLEKMYDGEVPYSELTGSNNHNVIAPCIIINASNNSNKPFSFGGHDETTFDVQATIITDNEFNLQGALSIFRDLNEKCFPLLNFEDIPWDAKGDLKTGYFNYPETKAKYPDPQNWAVIDRVISNTPKPSNKGNNNFRLGYCEFKTLSYRFPRQ